MIYFEKGAENYSYTSAELREIVFSTLKQFGPKKKVLVIPPDFTRFHSRAGEITEYVWEFYGENLTDILPALGTHNPMSDHELQTMFGKIPLHLFRVHDWRNF